MEEETNSPKCLSLPNDLIASIAKRLETRVNSLLLRAVCSKFRASVPLPAKPLSPNSTVYIPSPVSSKTCHCSQLSLTLSTFYAIQPIDKALITPDTTSMWLVNIEESNSGKVLFRDPLTGIRFHDLSNLPKALNLLDHRVKEIAKSYDLGLVDDRKRKEPEDKFNERRAYFVQKVAVSPCFDEKDDRFAIMAIHSMSKLGIWRKYDINWTEIAIGDGRVYLEDVAFYNKKFYAVNKMGLTISVDPKSLKVTEVVTSHPKFNGTGVKYLVKSFEDLFLVVKQIFVHPIENEFDIEENSNGEYIYPIHVIVYKLDEEQKQWVHLMDGVKDTAFFLDNDCSFSISVKEFPGCRENCVYFADSVFISSFDDKFPGWYAGIYDLKGGNVGPLSAFQEYSKIFWPPPSWLNELKIEMGNSSTIMDNKHVLDSNLCGNFSGDGTCI